MRTLNLTQRNDVKVSFPLDLCNYDIWKWDHCHVVSLSKDSKWWIFHPRFQANLCCLLHTDVGCIKTLFCSAGLHIHRVGIVQPHCWAWLLCWQHKITFFNQSHDRCLIKSITADKNALKRKRLKGQENIKFCVCGASNKSKEIILNTLLLLLLLLQWCELWMGREV